MENIRISPVNVYRWFAEQITHPSTFFKKKSWGVFSEFAHIRRSDRQPKKVLPSKEAAQRTADFMAGKYGGTYTIYKCVYCDGWHVAKTSDAFPNTPVAMTQPVQNSANDVSSNIDYDSILQLDIPDLARVYGGVRGRTMSSKHQEFAWPEIKRCGIKTIIDLREDGRTSRLVGLCKRYGMEYFYYPVDRKCENIKHMVDLFPELCRKLDAGNFYIACAMGLHRTDIALCCYWVFYAADKGITPPPIRGYRKEQGHTTDKIMRVLNAMYKELNERNGVPPIPQPVFVERKRIIEQLSGA